MEATFKDEYHEIQSADSSVERRRGEIVRCLLAGEPVDGPLPRMLGYEIPAHSHLGIVARGPGVEVAMSRVKTRRGFGALVIFAGDGEAWGWIVDRETDSIADLKSLLLQGDEPGVSAGVGGPYPALDGFRRAHQEAREALRRALRRRDEVVYYADGPLLAAVLRNEPLRRWLKDLVAPLTDAQCRALRVYIDKACNVSSAAAEIEVHRHTFDARMAAAEKRIGRDPRKCLAEISVTLDLAEWETNATTQDIAKMSNSDGQIVH